MNRELYEQLLEATGDEGVSEYLAGHIADPPRHAWAQWGFGHVLNRAREKGGDKVLDIIRPHNPYRRPVDQ